MAADRLATGYTRDGKGKFIFAMKQLTFYWSSSSVLAARTAEPTTCAWRKRHQQITPCGCCRAGGQSDQAVRHHRTSRDETF